MAAEGHRMALRCTASASKRPEEVRKPQQVLAARFKLCGRKPLPAWFTSKSKVDLEVRIKGGKCA